MAKIGATTFIRLRLRGGSGSWLLLAVLTTTQRNALSASVGYIIYNSTTTQIEVYNGSSWVAVGKVYGDATFLPLAGGTMSGNIAMSGAQTVDGVDVSAHAANISAHQQALSWRPGHYFVGEAQADIGLDDNTLYAVVFYLPRAMTFDMVSVSVSSAPNGNLRLGLYGDDGSLYPGARVKDFGAVAISGISGLKSISSSTILAPGIYWLVCGTDDLSSAGLFTPWRPALVRGIGSDNLVTHYAGWSCTWAFGALPDPFPAGGTLHTSPGLAALRVLTND